MSLGMDPHHSGRPESTYRYERQHISRSNLSGDLPDTWESGIRGYRPRVV